MQENETLIPAGDPSEGPFVFISYAHEDMEAVQQILQVLQRNHFRFWYDEGLRSGEEWADCLAQNMDTCEQFLVFLSKNADRSKYVRKEVNYAVDVLQQSNVLAFYLEPPPSSGGLKFLLSDIHAIHLYKYQDERACEAALCKSISVKCFKNENCGMDISQIPTPASQKLITEYVDLNEFSSGGLSTVYIGRQVRTGAPVVVKHGTLDDTFRGKTVLEVFSRERDILMNGLENRCPCAPVLLDWFQDEKNVYLVESYIAGQPLAEPKMRSERQTVDILRQLLRILAYLHERGILHGDIKPRNLLQDDFGRICLIDFNLSHRVGSDAVGITRLYSAPELSANHPLPSSNTSADIYSAGCTALFLLSGQAPPSGPVPPVRSLVPAVSPQLEAILCRMTSPDPDDRYQSAAEVLEALEGYDKVDITRRLWDYLCSVQRIIYYRRRVNTAKRRSLKRPAVADFDVSMDSDTILLDGQQEPVQCTK